MLKKTIILIGLITGILSCSAKFENFSIKLKGSYGCIGRIYYSYSITSDESNRFKIVATGKKDIITIELSPKNTAEIIEKVKSIQWQKFPDKIGKLDSTADFEGYLVIKYNKAKIVIKKSIHLTIGQIENSTLKNFLKYLMSFLDKNERIPIP